MAATYQGCVAMNGYGNGQSIRMNLKLFPYINGRRVCIYNPIGTHNVLNFYILRLFMERNQDIYPHL